MEISAFSISDIVAREVEERNHSIENLGNSQVNSDKSVAFQTFDIESTTCSWRKELTANLLMAQILDSDNNSVLTLNHVERKF